MANNMWISRVLFAEHQAIDAVEWVERGHEDAPVPKQRGESADKPALPSMPEEGMTTNIHVEVEHGPRCAASTSSISDGTGGEVAAVETAPRGLEASGGTARTNRDARRRAMLDASQPGVSVTTNPMVVENTPADQFTPSDLTVPEDHGDDQFDDQDEENNDDELPVMPERAGQTLTGRARVHTRHNPNQTLTGRAGVHTVTEEQGGLDEAAFSEANKFIFANVEWERGLAFLQKENLSNGPGALAFLRDGSLHFGFWSLSETVLKGLAKHLLGCEPSPTVVGARRECLHTVLGRQGPSSHSITIRKSWPRMKSQDAITASETWMPKKRIAIGIKLGFKASIFVIGAVYGLEFYFYQYPNVSKVLGWQVVISRSTAMAMMFLTAFLFLSMSRSVMTWTSRQRWCNCVEALRDTHKELHIIAGELILYYGIVHTLGHLIGTAPGFITHSPAELNAVLGCANPARTKFYLGVDLGFLVLPKCPITEEAYKQYTYLDVLLRTTPGLSGVALWLIYIAVLNTARERQRKDNYDRFWYVHNFAILTWPPLLFIHGANGWVGFGFPLVVFVAGLPMIMYSIDRIVWRFFFYFGGMRYADFGDVIIRPGKDGGHVGAITKVSLKMPSVMRCRRRHHEPGMYAYVNMPDYAPLQWHPFTIVSGRGASTVDFIIMGLGDWTQEFARRLSLCMSDPKNKPPRVLVDGPYTAPTQRILTDEIMVAIGAGVGITPFVATLATLVAEVESTRNPQKAHFYWMTRAADEFLFARAEFTKVLNERKLQGRVYLHLHVTAQVPARSASGFIFREVIKRQSVVDRKHFMASVKAAGGPDPAATDLEQLSEIWGSQMPWCWLYGTKQDVLWVSDLVATNECSHPVIPSSRRCSVKSASWKVDPAAVDGPGDELRSSTQLVMPVVFGRPDFETELPLIGKNYPGSDISIFVCGNDAIVKNLEAVVNYCNTESEKAGVSQRYKMSFERFG